MDFIQRNWAILVAGVVVAISVSLASGVYLIATTIQERQANMEIDLPPAKKVDEQAGPTKLIVEMSSDGKFTVAGSPIELSQVKQQMDAKGLGELTLRVSKLVRYETVKEVLTNLGNQGVTDITFSVVDSEAPAPKADGR